ncbi:restriction endonuclease subunit S [Slackia isoflavoniconvertens]|uniref:Restriction endonuclease subunit S n=1 Tax=Slackia isoflavoniconvertens TaxID=572010 RepID=A0A369LIZ3_9ACTN|nr:restriction endonuclease subunit S [Slackia isoflavoniconvertens]
MAERTNVPEIRFAGFTDPWEQRKFSEIVDVCSGRDYKHLNEGPIPVYGTGGYMTSVCEALSHNRDAVGIGRKGTIDKPYLLKAPFWTVDTLFYAIPKPDINLEFALCSFLNVDWKSKDESTGLPSLSKEAINETVLRVPNAVEQNHLGSFFTDLDSLITLHQRKHDKLVQLKKSMLDKMFPKPGETEPKIRFAGFTDPWEQRKLGELCTFSKGHGYSKADIRDAGTPLILYGRLYTQFESRIEEVDTFAVEQDGSILSRGNEVIVPASGETAEDIAVASSVRRSGIILGGDLNVVTPTSKLDPDYTALAITYSKAHDDLAKRAQGKSVVHVHGNDIAEVEVSYPSESEQKRISSVVLNLDSLITLHQRKLGLLRNTKKSLLDRMFV